MGVVIEPIEMLALKKLAVICGALASSLQDPSARREQKALTQILIAVITRAEIDNARAHTAGERQS